MLTDPVATVQAAVDELADRLDALIKLCDDEHGAGLVELLGDVRTARQRLYALEDTIERAALKAMFADGLSTSRYVAERYRSRDRKEWRREDWQRDVREKVMRKHALLNVELVNADGELVEAEGAVWLALADVQAVYGSATPNVTPLRELGLSADDYCTTSPGRAGVRTKPIGDEGDS